MKAAVLVDGSFFIRRYRSIDPDWRERTPSEFAEAIYGRALSDLGHANKKRENCRELYRIFFYDCPPLEKRLRNPISGRGFDFGKTADAKFRAQLLEELKRFRKVAIRLGRISATKKWLIKARSTEELFKGQKQFEELTENDVYYEVRQKGVDMKIGLDIASLSYKKNVDQIILIAGDSDFVPASKLARREGIDFVLDPMENNVNPDLHEHIDGMINHKVSKIKSKKFRKKRN